MTFKGICKVMKGLSKAFKRPLKGLFKKCCEGILESLRLRSFPDRVAAFKGLLKSNVGLKATMKHAKWSLYKPRRHVHDMIAVRGGGQ